MILLKKQRLVLITPPHTGSGALHKILCNPKHGGKWINGINPDGNIDHHYGRVHDGWVRDGYKIAMVIREPCQRMHGLWFHYRWWLDSQDLRADVSFDEYLSNPPVDWFHTETQFEFYKRNCLDELDCEIMTTEIIDDCLAVDHGIEIRPDYDYTALYRPAAMFLVYNHEIAKTKRWIDETAFFRNSGVV